jgi:hypothetical protein
MEAQISRLNRTMNELLRFARPTAPNLLAVDVNPLLDRVLFLLKKQQDGSGIVFRRVPPFGTRPDSDCSGGPQSAVTFASSMRTL